MVIPAGGDYLRFSIQGQKQGLLDYFARPRPRPRGLHLWENRQSLSFSTLALLSPLHQLPTITRRLPFRHNIFPPILFAIDSEKPEISYTKYTTHVFDLVSSCYFLFLVTCARLIRPQSAV